MFFCLHICSLMIVEDWHYNKNNNKKKNVTGIIQFSFCHIKVVHKILYEFKVSDRKNKVFQEPAK